MLLLVYTGTAAGTGDVSETTPYMVQFCQNTLFFNPPSALIGLELSALRIRKHRGGGGGGGERTLLSLGPVDFFCGQDCIRMKGSTVLVLGLLFAGMGLGETVDIKEEAEQWFTKQATGLTGKRFLEKVKCAKFYKYMEKTHPGFFDKNENKLNVMSTVR